MQSLKKVDDIKEIIIQQAKYFLDEFGGFYPFGAAIDRENIIHPIGIQMEEDYPDSNDMIKKLEEAFSKAIAKGDYLIVGIGSDVLTTIPYIDGKIDAVEIRIASESNYLRNFYLPYKKDDVGNFIFFEIYETQGSLILSK